MGRANSLVVFGVFAGLILGASGMGTGVKPLLTAGTLLAGSAFAATMVQCQRTGVIRTDVGFLRRSENPVGFRAASMFWWTVLLLWTLAGVLHGLDLPVKRAG